MEAKKIVFLGNCQALALANVYRTHIGDFDGQVVTHIASFESAKTGHNALVEADVVVVQLMDFRAKVTADNLSAGARRIDFPMVAAGFIWPFGSQPHPQNVSEGNFPGFYPAQLGDSFLNQMIAKGVSPEEAVKRYLDDDIGKRANLDRLFELYLDKQRKRDERTGYNLGELIEGRFRDDKLFLTPDHPNLTVFNAMFSQVCSDLGISAGRVDKALSALTETPFPLSELPIHPAVIKHFGLSFVNENATYRYFEEGRFTFAEYAVRYMKFEHSNSLRQGIFLVHSPRGTEALAKLRTGLQEAPRSAVGHHLISVLLAERGDLVEAIASERRALSIDPLVSRFHCQLGELFARRGDLLEAECAFRQAIQLAPNHSQSCIGLAEVLCRHGRSDEALATVQNVATEGTRVAHVYSRIGHLMISKSDLPGAEHAFRQAIAIDPSVTGFHNALADVLGRQSRIDEALALVQKLAAMGVRDAHLYSRIGQLLIRKGDLSGAEQAFRQAIELDAGVMGFHNALVDVLGLQGRIDEALTVVQKLAEEGSRDAHVYSRIGRLLIRKGNLIGAEQAIRRAITIDSAVIDFHNILVDILGHQDRVEEALAIVQKLAAEGTRDAHLYARTAHLLVRKDDLDGAEQALRQAIAIDPNVSGIHNALANVLTRKTATLGTVARAETSATEDKQSRQDTSSGGSLRV